MSAHSNLQKILASDEKIIEKAAVMLVTFLYSFLNMSIELARNVIYGRKIIPEGINKILIFRIGKIGDTICAVPSIAAIRENYPKAKIVLLSSPGRYGSIGAKEILGDSELLDGLITYYQEEISSLTGKIRLFNELRKFKFDLFIELSPDKAGFATEIRNIFFSRSIGVKYALGFRLNTLKLFKRIQSKYLKFDDEVQRLLNILQKEGLKASRVSFPLTLSEKEKQEVSNFICGLNKYIVAINPHANRQTNLLPLNKFSEIGRRLVDNFNCSILIIGGSTDKERSFKLTALIGRGAVDVAARFSVLQTIELLRCCNLLISGDTGSIHMAVAAGTPLIGLYSAWQIKGKWYPYGNEDAVIRNEPECHTCYLNKCEHLTCLNMFSTDEIYRKAGEILTG